MNQDGASNGLSAPSGPAQERVIRQALSRAGLTPDDVDAVEGHGTGTRLGDPIEAGALLATYGQGRDGAPLWLGSLKSNIGHTQAAAGVAGVIKMVMALQRGTLPPTLHAEEPSEHIEWSTGDLRLLTQPIAWPDRGRPRRAAVSSFGISGTNAHVILEAAPATSAAPVLGEPALRTELLPFLISGSGEAALAAQAGRLKEHLKAHGDQEPRVVAGTLALKRARLAHRAAVLAAGSDDLARRLDAVAQGAAVDDGVLRGVVRQAPRVGFVFPGQGGQWPGMAVSLYEQSDVFARRMDECAVALASHLDFDLMGVLRDGPGHASLDRIEVVQPALFAVMVSLAALWQSFGVEPVAVVGHSQGEIAAACVGGGMSLEDAARIVCVRSRALAQLEGGGGMLAVALSAAEFDQRSRPFEGRVNVSAINGPASLVASGDPDALEALERELQADGVRTRRIASSVPGHSPAVDVTREVMLSALADIAPRPGSIPLYSTVTGEPLGVERMDAEHWFRNLRQTVLFEPAVRQLAKAGVDTLIEIGPHPVLTAPALEILEQERAAATVAVLSTLRRGEGGADRFVSALADAHVHGVPVNWAPLFAGAQPSTSLPTYAFQRRRYWLSQRASARGGRGTEGAHPLLRSRVALASGRETVWTGHVSPDAHRWLGHDAFLGTAVAPSTVLLELALHAALELDTPVVETLLVTTPLTFDEHGALALQLTVSDQDAHGRRSIDVFSRSDDDGDWTRHASGTLCAESGLPSSGPPDENAEALVSEIALDPDLAEQATAFELHPALAHAALQAAAPLAGQVPVAFHGVRLHRRGAASLSARVTPVGNAVRVEAADAAGAPLFAIDEVHFGHLDVSDRARRSDGLLQVRWTTAAVPQTVPNPADVVVLGDEVSVDTSHVERFDDLDTLLLAIAAGAPAPQHVLATVQVRADEPLPGAAHTVSAMGLELIQAWLAAQPLEAARLTLVTERAVVAVDGERADLRQAPLVGLVRSAASEHPGRFGLIDIEPGRETPLSALTDEPEVAVRNGVALVPRLQRWRGTRADGRKTSLSGGTVLVTGGTTGIGALLATRLAERHGAEHLLLVSRRGADSPGVDAVVTTLRGLGVDVEVAACDVADRTALERLLESIPAERPLIAVAHAAAALDDGVISALDQDRLRCTMRPKVDGALHLHELTSDLDLKEFILFSSVAATIGTPGQANYAAGNAFLEALAHARHADGLPALALAFGFWERVTTLTEHLTTEDGERMGPMGLLPMSDEEGLDLTDAARETGEPVLVPVRLDAKELASRARSRVLPPILSDLVRASRQIIPTAAVASTRQSDDVGRRVDAAAIAAEVASALGYPSADALDPEISFLELGVDSLIALELRNRLRAMTGLLLPTTLVFDHRSPAALTEYIERQFDAANAGAAPLAANGNRNGARPSGDAGTLTTLFRRAHRLGRPLDGVAILESAARLRPRFGLSHAEYEAPPLHVLSQNAGGPVFCCVPSVIATSGPHEFARLARGFPGGPEIVAVENRGFQAEAPLPTTVEAAAAAQAVAIRRHVGDRPAVLIGYSTGGVLAYATAAQCVCEGVQVAAVVLIDSYDVGRETGLLERVIDRMFSPGRAQPDIDDDKLMAMAAYLRALREWRPERAVAPTLLVRAAGESSRTRSLWPHRDAVVTVDADHLTIIEEEAETTAIVIEAWVRSRRARPTRSLARLLERARV